jgi:plasmid stability protein
MPDILIRGLSAQTINRLKSRANRHNRSLQNEITILLERAAGVGSEQIEALFRKWDERLAGRRLSSSTQMIRKDRDR